MSNVNINIRGRDEGLGSQLDSLREKAKSLGVELSTLTNSWDNANGTQHKRDTVTDAFLNGKEETAAKIRAAYDELRKLNKQDFDNDASFHARGKMSDAEFDRRRSEYNQSNNQLNTREQQELKQLDKDSNLQLRQIYRLLLERDKRRREKEQNDDEEFLRSNGGRGMRGGRGGGEGGREYDPETDGIRVFVTNWPESLGGRGGDGGDGGDGGSGGRKTDRWGRAIGAAGAAGSGDLVGATNGVIGMVGGGAAAIGTAIVAAIASFMFNGQKVQENLEQAAAMRGFGLTGAGTNRFFAGNLTSQWKDIGKLGKSPDEIASMMGEKALSSRVGGEDLIRRTIDDYTFQKGFGADAGIFSQFERFNKGQSESTEIALDVLNTLVSIKESSLKEGDLVTLGEKLQSASTIMDIQRQKRDSTDSAAAIRLLSGFESIGLSGKGEKAGDFLQRTINGLGEGGSDDIMMLKYQMAGQFNPALLNDPAAMKKFIRWGADSPEFMKFSLGFLNDKFGGNEMNYMDILDAMFPGYNQYEMEMYRKGGKMDLRQMTGVRQGSLTKGQMQEDAQASVGQMSEWMSQFQGMMQNMYQAVIDIGDFFNGGGNPDKPLAVTDKKTGKVKYYVEDPKKENDRLSGGVGPNF